MQFEHQGCREKSISFAVLDNVNEILGLLVKSFRARKVDVFTSNFKLRGSELC
jgi:hypothetical protein